MKPIKERSTNEKVFFHPDQHVAADRNLFSSLCKKRFQGNLISCEIRQNSFGQKDPTSIHVTCKTNSKGALTEYTLSGSINNPVSVQYSGSKISFLKPKSADTENHSQYILSIWYNADGTVKTFLQGPFI